MRVQLMAFMRDKLPWMNLFCCLVSPRSFLKVLLLSRTHTPTSVHSGGSEELINHCPSLCQYHFFFLWLNEKSRISREAVIASSHSPWGRVMLIPLEVSWSGDRLSSERYSFRVLNNHFFFLLIRFVVSEKYVRTIMMCIAFTRRL